jgi:O-antigen/teichoic acid export membrane protein
MRLKHSARNLAAAWTGQAVYVVLNFVTLSVFNRMLGQQYLDVQGLFTTVLTILSLSELGIGSAIIFALYEPLAKGEDEKVRSLMRLFKRCYLIIGSFIICVGVGLAPFIEYFINGSTPVPLDELRFYFFCFVLNSGVSYFFVYRSLLISASQKQYLVSIISYSANVLRCVAQIILLVLTHNYLLFLICMVGSTFLGNAACAWLAGRMFPYLKSKAPIAPVDPPVLSRLKKNIFAMILHKVATVATMSTSTLVINASVGTGLVGSYYSYTMIINTLGTTLDQAFGAIVASIGNLAVLESSERQYEVFKTTFLFNALLYTVTAVPLLCGINAFVTEIWLDSGYQLPTVTIVLIVLFYYFKGMRATALSFTGAYGLYWQTKFKPVVETLVLVGFSIALVGRFEIAGVVAAGIISTVFVCIVYEGYTVFKYALKRSCRGYFLRLGLYVLVALVLAGIASALCLLVPGQGLLPFLIKIFLGLAVAFLGFIVAFGRTAEFTALRGMIVHLLREMQGKLRKTV